MNRDKMTVCANQLTELKERISKAAMYTETMWKQYSALAEDSRYSDRAEDSRIRSDVYCDCTLLLLWVLETSGE